MAKEEKNFEERLNELEGIVKELEKRNLQVRDINFIADENQEKKCDISFSCSDNPASSLVPSYP